MVFVFFSVSGVLGAMDRHCQSEYALGDDAVVELLRRRLHERFS